MQRLYYILFVEICQYVVANLFLQTQDIVFSPFRGYPRIPHSPLKYDSEENLIAFHHTVEEIAKIIGVDSLGYLATDELRELVGNDDFCSACFTNEYPTSIPKGGSKNRFEQKLSHKKK